MVVDFLLAHWLLTLLVVFGAWFFRRYIYCKDFGAV